MAADGNITKDVIYDAVAPDDFESMLSWTLQRPLDGLRQDHLGDARPLLGSAGQEVHRLRRAVRHGKRDAPPRGDDHSLSTDYVNHLTDWKTRVRFANQSALRSFSSILHGEQGALNLSASLCHVLKDQGAQEYAANQTREEARHRLRLRHQGPRWGRPGRVRPDP